VKPLVQYTPFDPTIEVGKRAMVVTYNHPDIENVTPGQVVFTTRVVTYDEATGTFETANTRYILKGDEE